MTKTPRTITLRYRTIDRFSWTKRFKTLEGARACARKWLGETFDIGPSYAVSFDGMATLYAEGCTLDELLTKEAS